MVVMSDFAHSKVKGIKESKGDINWESSVGINLGKIIEDGLRGYICCGCGERILEAHHIKPETFKIIYKGVVFYLERHLCDECYLKSEVKKLIEAGESVGAV